MPGTGIGGGVEAHVRMAERSKALRSGRSPLLWAWVRIPLLTLPVTFPAFPAKAFPAFHTFKQLIQSPSHQFCQAGDGRWLTAGRGVASGRLIDPWLLRGRSLKCEWS